MRDSGWIILDKARGMFSRTAGGRVARLLGIRKFGHIGTLDEMATGVLPIAFGNATKMIPFIENLPGADTKEYLFSCVFGHTTDTLDTFGTETARDDFVPDMDTVRAAITKLTGKISQIPPIYSAVHVDGERAYAQARKGKNIEIPAREITVYTLEFCGKRENEWDFRVVCSRGTYVRAIVRDIAELCGAMATTTAIRRVRTGTFDIKNALTLDFLENLVNNGGDIGKYLMPADFGLADIPVLNLSHESADVYIHGGFVQTVAAHGVKRVYCDEQFIGIGCVTDGVLRPKRTL